MSEKTPIPTSTRLQPSKPTSAYLTTASLLQNEPYGCKQTFQQHRQSQSKLEDRIMDAGFRVWLGSTTSNYHDNNQLRLLSYAVGGDDDGGFDDDGDDATMILHSCSLWLRTHMGPPFMKTVEPTRPRMPGRQRRTAQPLGEAFPTAPRS